MKIAIYQILNKKYVGFKRVPYGKKDTPGKDKEYGLEGVPSSPVGNRKEIKKFMEEKLEHFDNFDGVMLIDNINGHQIKEFISTENL